MERQFPCSLKHSLTQTNLQELSSISPPHREATVTRFLPAVSRLSAVALRFDRYGQLSVGLAPPRRTSCWAYKKVGPALAGPITIFLNFHWVHSFVVLDYITPVSTQPLRARSINRDAIDEARASPKKTETSVPSLLPASNPHRSVVFLNVSRDSLRRSSSAPASAIFPCPVNC